MELNTTGIELKLTDDEYNLLVKLVKDRICDLEQKVNGEGQADLRAELDNLTALNYYMHMGFRIGE